MPSAVFRHQMKACVPMIRDLGGFQEESDGIPRRAGKAWARAGWDPKRARSLIRPEGGLRVMFVLGLLGLWSSLG